jgi:hypothetical protein
MANKKAASATLVFVYLFETLLAQSRIEPAQYTNSHCKHYENN